MTTIAVASGKGGAGKTSVAAALAALLTQRSDSDCVVADCDVDAANGAIALGATIRKRAPYLAGPGFSVDPTACTACGNCSRTCRFRAVREDAKTGRYRIVPELCERCGACFDACPSGAIVMEEKQAGEVFVSDTRLGIPLAHAELDPGEDTSGKLVRRVRESAEALAGEDSRIVVDCPPGIGCPVIASLSGTDLVLAVIEASASGIRDAGRLLELVSSMGRRTIALLNKTGLDSHADEQARALAERSGVPIMGTIPFDPDLRSVEESGHTWLDSDVESGSKARAALNAVLESILALERERGKRNVKNL